MNDICIIIPTHDRHNYLVRSLKYYSGFNCQVFVCDSSAQRYSQTLPANVSYHHLPGQRFAEKILYALTISSHPFLALSPDDDFLFEESLTLGMEALEANSRARACVGDVLSFPDVPPFRIVSHDSSAGVTDAVSNDSSKNIRNYLLNYHQILWGMFRRDALQKCFSVIAEADYSNENFFEMTIATICAGDGGIHYLDDLWILRELSLSEHWGTRHRQIGREINLEMDIDVAKFRRLIDAELFDGAAEVALNAYLEGRPPLQKFALIQRLWSKATAIFWPKKLKTSEIKHFENDHRFAPIIWAINS